jgi:PAS domain S-box-containing protein
MSIEGEQFTQSTFRDITEHKKAEETLQESEERFRSLSESSPMGVFHTDKEGRVLYTNKRWQEITDMTLEESLGFGWSNALHPDEKKPLLEEWERCVSEEKDYSGEFRFVSKSGEVKWVYTKTAPIGSETGQVIGHVGSNEDITERKQADKALKESESRFRELVENINEVFWMENAEGTELLYVSPAFEQIWGRSCQSFYNNHKEWIDAIHPDDRRRVVDAFNKFRETGAYSEEFRILQPGGSIRWILDRGVLIYDESGQVHHVAGIAEDITQRKQAQEALRENEVTARALLNATTDAVLLIDKEGLIIDINERMSEWLGHSRKDLIGTIIYNHLPPEIAEQRKTKGFEAVRTRRPISFEDQREGRWLENNVCPILDSHGEASRFAIYSRDITERKQAEEKLLDYQEQLQSLASELTLAEERERRRIATELHDEISQSLFISKMKLEALDKSASDKKYDDTLDEINNSLGRIIAAMRSLTFDLSSPILYEFGFEEAVAEWLNEQVEKKHGIATELEDDGLPKQMDDDIRVILFRNVRELLINVVKHARAKKVKVSIQKVGRRIRISVEDDGVGFDSAGAESLITGKEAFGLFSIRERLEPLGGNLEIKSSPGCGCRITITSPLKREDIREGK